MKRTLRALALLLAAVALLLAPSAARENERPRLVVNAVGLDGEPGQPRGHGGSNPLRAVASAAQAAPAEHLVAQTGAMPWREGQSGSSGSRMRATGERASVPAMPWRAGEKETDQGTTADAPRTSPATAGQAERRTDSSGSTPIRLFGTLAFRGNFNALPKWKRVLSKAEGQVRALNSCTSGKGCPPGAASWQRIMAQARGLAPMEQLKKVNSFFNKWPYRLDQDIYGTSDWWATPQEFLKLSGDCEDYSITKYYALRELGFSPDNLRIVVLKDRIRGIAHAILVVMLDGDAYVLDNVSSVVFSHNKYSHYVPYYSLNENYRWSHIPVDRKP